MSPQNECDHGAPQFLHYLGIAIFLRREGNCEVVYCCLTNGFAFGVALPGQGASKTVVQ